MIYVAAIAKRAGAETRGGVWHVGASFRPDECLRVTAEELRYIDAALDSRTPLGARNTLPDDGSRLRARLWRERSK